MNGLKQAARSSFLRPIYLWLANRYRQVRRWFIYPDTARVGVVDYDAYWAEKFAYQAGTMSSWRQRRAEAFAALMQPGDRVLDLGVGDGALLKYMIDTRQVDGYGLDISEQAVAFCRSIGLNVDLADVNQPVSAFVKAEYDYVVLSEIIEHIPDPEKLLVELRPHVNRAILVSVPNTGFYNHRMRLLLGRFPLQWVVTPGEHLRFWTLADFRWWAGALGFRVVRAIPYEGTPLLKHLLPGWFAAGFVYVLQTVESSS